MLNHHFALLLKSVKY